MINHKINAGLQVVPHTEHLPIYPIIDEAIKVIQQSGLRYMVTPMETVIEGHYDEVMTVVKRAQEAALAAGAQELVVTLRLHIKKASDVSFEDKTAKFN
ncbi:thiamine-binding protein [Fulvivirga sp.]|uniref:thiamine-binding protein n=1 Tax=Fulvivirga sp. TaxID=1931237 RepID=UPI0032EFDD0D